jgi:hypothetical protein
VSESSPPRPRPHRAEPPPGDVFTRTLSELGLAIPHAVDIFRRAWLPALVSIVVFGLPALIAIGMQACCGLTLLVGGWSFASAILHVGPLTAFGRAAAGETPRVAGVLAGSVRGFGVTFLSFAPQSISFVISYIAAIFVMALPALRDVGGGGSIAVFLAVLTVSVACGWLWLRVVLRWLVLAPVVFIAERPITIGASFARAGELARGRLLLVAFARFVPDAVFVMTFPQWNGLAQFDRTVAYKNVVWVLAPALGLIASAFATGLLAGAVYLVATGARVPGLDEE